MAARMAQIVTGRGAIVSIVALSATIGGLSVNIAALSVNIAALSVDVAGLLVTFAQVHRAFPSAIASTPIAPGGLRMSTMTLSSSASTPWGQLAGK
jgi:hypothetical protein